MNNPPPTTIEISAVLAIADKWLAEADEVADNFYDEDTGQFIDELREQEFDILEHCAITLRTLCDYYGPDYNV